MQITDYPSAIASLQVQILNLNTQIEKISQHLNNICNQIETKVAFDPELKNEQQRKCRIAELKNQSGDYEQWLTTLLNEKAKRDHAEIRLEQMRSEFAVVRLLKREVIAKLEASTEIRV